MRRSVRYAEIARTNPWVRAAVDVRASVGSRVPLHVFRPTTDDDDNRGDRMRVRAGEGGPGARLPELLGRPEPRLSGRRFRRRILTDRLIHGTALVEQLRSGGQVVGLAWHPWSDVVPHATDDGRELTALEVPVSRRTDLFPGLRHLGETRMIDRDDAILVLDVEEISLTHGPVGLSPLASMHATHALYDAAMRFALAYLDNGIFPAGVVELDPKFSPEAATATRELLEAIHARVENAGTTPVLAGRWRQVMATPEGAKLLELAKWSREEVAAGYRIPLPVLGDISTSNRSTSQSSREQFVRDVVGDDVSILESEFNAQLVGGNRRWSAAGLWVEGQLAEQLRPDMAAMANVLHKQVGGPVMTPNDGRRVINLEPLEDERADRLIFNPGTPESDIEEDPDDDEDDDDQDDL